MGENVGKSETWSAWSGIITAGISCMLVIVVVLFLAGCGVLELPVGMIGRGFALQKGRYIPEEICGMAVDSTEQIILTLEQMEALAYATRKAYRETDALPDDICIRCQSETTTYVSLLKYANRLHDESKSEPHHYSEYCEDCYAVQYELRRYRCHDCGEKWLDVAEVGWIFECTGFINEI